MSRSKTEQIVIDSVVRWFERAVLGLNLCPFAFRPYQQGAIRFELSMAESDESCLTDLFLNLRKLDQQPAIETLVMICPNHLQHFADYNQFLSLAEHLLGQEGWAGVYQIASFHPDYQFAGTGPEDRSNWTNRSPYPLLHLIRESSIESAVQVHPHIDDIPDRNIKTLLDLSEQDMKDIFGSRYRKH